MTTATETDERVVDCFGAERLRVPDALTITKSETPPKDCGMFHIMSQPDGDKRVVWSRRSLLEINAAKSMFNDLIQKGMIPYCVGADGRKSSTVMGDFDAAAEGVIFVPQHAITGG